MTDCYFSISCEPHEELCEHGRNKRWGCLLCDNKDISYKSLMEMYMSLQVQVESLREHKLRQIDENRKISRRVNELEKLNQQCFDANSIKKIDERFEKIESYIEMEDRVTASSVLYLLDELKRKLSKLENLIDVEKSEKIILDGANLHLTILKFEKRMQELEKKLIDCDTSKKPYKCPICEGKGLHESIIPTKSGLLDLTCTSCVGKGIIWG